MKTILAAVAILVVLVEGMPVASAGSYPTDEELRTLPPFCTWKLRGGKADLDRGFALLGEQFKNAHHYCAGLNHINRYYRAVGSPGAKSFLHEAVNEFTYMVEHLVPSSTLAGASYLGRATAYALWGRDGEAMQDYQAAVRHDPRLVRAYIAWADLLAERKLPQDALKVVTEGLRWNPGSRDLQNRYEKLGGKLPYPEPVVAQGKASAPADAQPNGPSPSNGDPKPADSGTSPALRAAPPQPNAAGANPDKPYCRFCPDEP
ncbi:hypothetical protein [Thiobacter aerophilum]|uniref:Tetratricopeptide repeat protein n=1 Tax=Thiobacter aerophilum TaxID=3121275 RepID=A0ABV0EDG6_9BURK